MKCIGLNPLFKACRWVTENPLAHPADMVRVCQEAIQEYKRNTPELDIDVEFKSLYKKTYPDLNMDMDDMAGDLKKMFEAGYSANHK